MIWVEFDCLVKTFEKWQDTKSWYAAQKLFLWTEDYLHQSLRPYETCRSNNRFDRNLHVECILKVLWPFLQKKNKVMRKLCTSRICVVPFFYFRRPLLNFFHTSEAAKRLPNFWICSDTALKLLQYISDATIFTIDFYFDSVSHELRQNWAQETLRGSNASS